MRLRKLLLIILMSLFVTGCSPPSKGSSSGSEAGNIPASSQKTEVNTNRDACWSFVQGFYDWYVPQTTWELEQKRSGPSYELALKYKRDAFSPALFKALKDDSDAQAKSDELVGIDFDPFLNTQDPEGAYQVRSITRIGIHCRTEVYRIGDEQKAYPDVAPDLVLEPDGWRFVNFYYPGPNSTDLMAILKNGAKMRKGYPGASPQNGH